MITIPIMSNTNEDKMRRNSRQKQRLMELLMATDIHPTADWLYERMRPDFPNLSLGTVYRNLRILSDSGRIRELRNGNSFSRFDARTDEHHHLVCRICGRIEDAPMRVDAALTPAAKHLNGFKIESHRLDFIGLCAECQPA